VSTVATSPAARTRAAVASLLADAGILSSLDAGAFYPQPIGVLVGLPALTGRTLGGVTFELGVFVVSGDPLNAELTVDRLYALADDVALAVRSDTYRPSSWRGSPNAEPLPAIEVLVTVTVDLEG
jgi:hypothetical protein